MCNSGLATSSIQPLFVSHFYTQTHPPFWDLTEELRYGPQVEGEEAVHSAYVDSYFLELKVRGTPPVLCMVRIRQCNFLNCHSMCLQPPPLILGQFMRGKMSEGASPKLDCGRSLRRGRAVFLYRDWSTGACGREKADDKMSLLVGYFCKRKWPLKYPNLRAWGWQSPAGSKNINKSLT